MSWELATPLHLLWGALPVALALGWIAIPRQKKARWVVPLHLPRAVLTPRTRFLRSAYRLFFTLITICLIGFAWVAARPIERETWTEKISEGIDIVISLDVSESMDADDFHPSRLVVAKQVIRDFIRRRPHDRIGLNVFGGEAVTKSPLTRDHDFLQAQVAAIALRELKQGTAIGMGIANAILRLKESKAKSKIIVLLTDGDSNVGSVNPVTASQLARQEGIRIYPIGIGHKNRVVIPIYQYDDFGRRGALITRIPSYINPALLREIAATTGGKAYMARDPGMLSRILLEIDRLERTKIQRLPREKQRDVYFELAAALTAILFAVYLALETRWKLGGYRRVAAV